MDDQPRQGLTVTPCLPEGIYAPIVSDPMAHGPTNNPARVQIQDN
jgi:hypothetical protein